MALLTGEAGIDEIRLFEALARAVIIHKGTPNDLVWTEKWQAKL